MIWKTKSLLSCLCTTKFLDLLHRYHIAQYSCRYLGEVVAENLDRYVPPRLLKTGSLVLIFGLKPGSPEWIFVKIWVSGAKNRHKIGLEMQDFFQKKSKWGLWSRKKAWKGEFPLLKFGLKKGGLEGSTSPQTLPMWVPPLGCRYCKLYCAIKLWGYSQGLAAVTLTVATTNAVAIEYSHHTLTQLLQFALVTVVLCYMSKTLLHMWANESEFVLGLN